MAKQVLIADSDKRVRRALRSLIAVFHDVEVCAEASRGLETVEAAIFHRPNPIILALRMPELNGIEVATIIKKNLPQTKMLLFTHYREHVDSKLASAAGIDMVLPKNEEVTALIKAVNGLLGLEDTSTSVEIKDPQLSPSETKVAKAKHGAVSTS